MVAIRMRRLGSKKKPFFRVVVAESHSARDGRSLEVLGYYNPCTKPETFHLDRARLEHWLTRGAQASDTVRTLLLRNKIEPLSQAEESGTLSSTVDEVSSQGEQEST